MFRIFPPYTLYSHSYYLLLLIIDVDANIAMSRCTHKGCVYCVNHENINVLTSLRNVRPDTNFPILMDDGEVYVVSGSRIAGVNGIISKRKRKKGVPRKKAEEFLEVAEKLKGKEVDILLMHETPYLPELFPFMRKESLAYKTAYEFIRVVKPKIVFNGHMHSGGYKTYTFPWGTKYVYVDSSQSSRHYLVFESLDKIEVWKDYKKIAEILSKGGEFLFQYVS